MPGPPFHVPGFHKALLHKKRNTVQPAEAYKNYRDQQRLLLQIQLQLQQNQHKARKAPHKQPQLRRTKHLAQRRSGQPEYEIVHKAHRIAAAQRLHSIRLRRKIVAKRPGKVGEIIQDRVSHIVVQILVRKPANAGKRQPHQNGSGAQQHIPHRKLHAAAFLPIASHQREAAQRQHSKHRQKPNSAQPAERKQHRGQKQIKNRGRVNQAPRNGNAFGK